MNRNYKSLFLIPLIGLMAFSITSCGKGKGKNQPYVAPAEPFPKFGNSLGFAVLSAQDMSNSGSSTVYGDVGVASPTARTYGMNGVKRTGGENHFNNAIAATALKDAGTAYTNIQNAGCDVDLSGKNLGGMTLTPGVYCISGNGQLDGLLTLDARGNIHANFVFQIAGSMNVAAGAGMRIINNGESCNVFWQVADSLSMGVGANIIGGFISMGNIDLDNGTKLNGKVMSRTGHISLNNSEIYNNFCPWW